MLGKLRTIQATEVDFQNRGTGESSHQSGFIQKIAAIFKDFSRTTLDFPLNSLSTIICILSWTTKKHQKALSRPLHSKLKKIQGLFKEKWNSRTFQGLPLKFKDFSRLREPCQYVRVYKTIFTLYWIAFALFTHKNGYGGPQRVTYRIGVHTFVTPRKAIRYFYGNCSYDV